MVKIFADDNAILKVGSELQLTPEYPAYKVTEMSTDPKSPYIRLELQLPQNVEQARRATHLQKYPVIELDNDKPLPIGRLENAEPIPEELLERENPRIVITTDDWISRLHGVLQYCPPGQFIYTHNGMNAAEGKDVTIETHAQAAVRDASATVSSHSKGDEANEIARAYANAERPTLDIPLKLGSRMAFHKFGPVYRVTESNDTEHTIKLIAEGKQNDPRWPAVINAEGVLQTVKDGEGKEIIVGGTTVGRAKDQKSRMLPRLISREQGFIGWSEEANSFVYHCKGAALPVVHASAGLTQEMAELCEKIDPSSPHDAQQQLNHARELIRRIDLYKDQLDDVQALEHSICNVKKRARKEGNQTERSQVGYALWLDVLNELYSGTLGETKEESQRKYEQVRAMSKVVNELADDRLELREVEACEDIPRNRSLREGTKYAEMLDKYIDRKYEELEANGEVYLLGAFKGHHAIHRLKRDDNGNYVLTTYNAGAGAIFVEGSANDLPNAKVMGVYNQQLISQPPAPKELIALISERKVRSEHNREGWDIALEVDNRLSEPHAIKIVTPQKTGNCTTRSTRHMLEHALGDDVMQTFGRHIADPEHNSGMDMKQALQVRVKALENWLDKHNALGEAEQPFHEAPALHDIQLLHDGGAPDSSMMVGKFYKNRGGKFVE